MADITGQANRRENAVLAMDRARYPDRLGDSAEAVISPDLAGHQGPKMDGEFQVGAFCRFAETPVEVKLGVSFVGDAA